MVYKHTVHKIQYNTKRRKNYLQQSSNKSLQISDLDKSSYDTRSVKMALKSGF